MASDANSAARLERAQRNIAGLMAIPLGPTGSGTVKCPSCGNALHFAYSRDGAALRAHCETPDCTDLIDD